MALSVRHHTDPAEFLAAALPALRARPVVNQLALGVAENVQASPERYGGRALFYTVEGPEGVEGVALQTPPWPVLLGESSEAARELLAECFAERHAPIAGVNGPAEQAWSFARAYCEITGATAALGHAMGVYELTQVEPVRRAEGAMVLATVADAALLQTWVQAFHDEATPDDPPTAPEAGGRLATQGRSYLFLDADANPVAFAVNSRSVEGWASVGPVYTPPEKRGRGYGTTLVADLSAHLLRTGFVGCTLFTDLSNATSNGIYQTIGYRRIGDAHRLMFRHP